MYHTIFDKKYLLKRLFIIVTLVLIIELILMIVGQLLSIWIIASIQRSFGVTYSDVIRNNPSSFLRLYAKSAFLLLLNVIVYLVFRLALKFKTHYLDLSMALIISTFLWSSHFNGPSGYIIPSYWGSYIAFSYLFASIQFIAFSLLTMCFDRLEGLRGWIRYSITTVAAIGLGMFISWYVWLPIIATYA